MTKIKWKKMIAISFVFIMICSAVCFFCTAFSSQDVLENMNIETHVSEQLLQGKGSPEDSEGVMDKEENVENSLEKAEAQKETSEEQLSSERLFNTPFLQALAGSGPEIPLSGLPEETVVVTDSWYPSADSNALNKWQIIRGNYLDGKNGASSQKLNERGDIIVRKNVIPTDEENIFRIALKIKAKASWTDVLDGTSVWLQNGNSIDSSQVHYFYPIKPSTGGPYVKATLNFVDSVSPSINGNIVYKKDFYVSMEQADSQGKWFLYWGNPLLDNIHHSMGQKGVPENDSQYYIPIGQYMTSIDQLHNAAVARSVTDQMGPGVEYIEDSVEYVTNIPGVSGLSKVSASGNTLTWNIDSDGTIPIGEDYQLTKDTLNGKISYFREYDLVYKVHLDTSREDFESGKEYPTNSSAVLSYSYDSQNESGVSDFQDYETGMHTIDFPVPSVKGTLYKMKLVKKDADTGEVLKGTVFTLQGSYGVSQLGYSTNIKKDDFRITMTTDEKGEAECMYVPWGDYTLTEESAPSGYDITFSPETYSLCFTTDRTRLNEDGSNYELKASEIGDYGVITDKSWPTHHLKLSKEVTNPDEIVRTSDKDAVFPINLFGFDEEQVLFFDELKNPLSLSDLSFKLKDGESVDLIVKMKEDHELCISENLDSLPYFKLNGINYTIGAEPERITDRTVTMKVSKDLNIVVKNDYIPQTIDLIIQKNDMDLNPLPDAEFTVYTSIQRDALPDADRLEYEGETYYQLDTLTTGDHGQTLSKKLSTLENPVYIIKETKSPNGYFILDQSIVFSIDEDKTVTLLNSSDYFHLEKGEDDLLKINVMNNHIYTLPDSGGIGTGLFSFSGMFIMASVLLMYFYHKERNRRDRTFS